MFARLVAGLILLQMRYGGTLLASLREGGGPRSGGRSPRVLYPTTRFMFALAPSVTFGDSSLPEGAFHAHRFFAQEVKFAVIVRPP